MARQYLRPEFASNPRLLVRIEPENACILINPTADELVDGLREVEKGTRKNKLHEVRLRRLFDNAHAEGFSSEWMDTIDHVPDNYGYELLHTQAAACWLGPDLLGFILKRARTPAGYTPAPPIYDLPVTDENYDPNKWLESVGTVFWSRLTDLEIEQLSNRALLQWILVRNRKRWEEAAHQRELHLRNLTKKRLSPEEKRRRDERLDQRADERWHEQHRNDLAQRECDEKHRLQKEKELAAILEELFMGQSPAFVSQFEDACRIMCEQLTARGEDRIVWRELKQCWPAYAGRFEHFFVPMISDGFVYRAALANVREHSFFTLSFRAWDGGMRLTEDCELVIRVNAEWLYRLLGNKNLTALKAVNEAIFANSNPWHPADAWTVGWLRVYVDDANKLIFVNEVQSDALESLRDAKVSLDPQEIRRIEKALTPWQVHGFASVRQWARKIGFRAALHSKESAGAIPGMTRSERKWNTYYEPLIKQFGLHSEILTGYPAAIMVEAQPDAGVLAAATAQIADTAPSPE